jgi:NADP-dependent 3-hydroxy acid dehydrogenase YdfG
MPYLDRPLKYCLHEQVIMNKFEGKVAFITGATSGIAAATAKTLAQRGVKVVVSGRREALVQN